MNAGSEVDVVYAKSMYAGAANASTKLAGEVLGIIAGPSPAEVRSGLNAVVDFLEYGATFISANDDDSIAYCITNRYIPFRGSRNKRR